MKAIRWDPEKSALLRADATRGGIGFEECCAEIEAERILAMIANPSSNHRGQKMFVLNINNYAYCVPFVESVREIFLKTVFPSRAMTAMYLTGDANEKTED